MSGVGVDGLPVLRCEDAHARGLRSESDWREVYRRRLRRGSVPVALSWIGREPLYPRADTDAPPLVIRYDYRSAAGATPDGWRTRTAWRRLGQPVRPEEIPWPRGQGTASDAYSSRVDLYAPDQVRPPRDRADDAPSGVPDLSEFITKELAP